MRDANGNADGNSDSYAYTDSYAYGDSNSYAYTDSYADGDSNSYAYTDSYADGDGNGYAYTDSYANCDGNGYAYADSYGYCDSNRYAYTDSYAYVDAYGPAETNPDTRAKSDTTASPIGATRKRLCGNSRENLASSPAKVVFSQRLEGEPAPASFACECFRSAMRPRIAFFAPGKLSFPAQKSSGTLIRFAPQNQPFVTFVYFC